METGTILTKLEKATPLSIFQNRLVNLGGRNRSIWLSKPVKSRDIDISTLPVTTPSQGFLRIKDAFLGKKVPLAELSLSRNSEESKAATVLKNLNKTASFIESETGSWDLVLGYPFVVGQLNTGVSIHGPLFMLPIRLEISANHWTISANSEADAQINRAILLSHSLSSGQTITDELLNLTALDLVPANTSPDDFLKVLVTQCYEKLKTFMDIAVPKDFFTETLEPFEELNKTELDAKYPAGSLYFRKEALISIMPQAGGFLDMDYQEMKQSNLLSVQDVFEKLHGLEIDTPSSESQVVEDFQESDLVCPLPLDASQEAIILQNREGKSQVVQGPPGTGKSQLIANLIADNLAAGKKVLVVCQKKAALDVVHERLSTVGLEPFLALVHDVSGDRGSFSKELGLALADMDQFEENGLEHVKDINAQWLQVCQRIDGLVANFEKLQKALHTKDETFKVSAHFLYINTQLTNEYLPVEAIAAATNEDELQAFLPKLAELLKLHRHTLPSLWHERIPTTSWAKGQYEMQDALSLLEKESKNLYGTLVWDSDKLQVLNGLVKQVQGAVFDAEIGGVITQFLENKELLAKSKSYLTQCQGIIQNCKFADEKPQTIALLEEKQKTLISIKSGFFSNMLKGFSNDFKEIETLASSLQLDATKPESWSVYIQEYHAAMALINSIPVALSIGNYPTHHQTTKTFQSVATAIKMAELLTTKPELNWYSYVASQNNQAHISLAQLAEIIQAKITAAKVLPLLTTMQTNCIAQCLENSKSFAQVLSADLTTYYGALQTHDDILSKISPVQKEIYTLATKIDANISIETISAAILHDIRLHWLFKIERKYPELSSASHELLQNREQELAALIQDKYVLAKAIVKNNVWQKAIDNIEYNRLGNAVTYKELKRISSLKSRVWPIRKIVTSYTEELLNVKPCWLLSPESVSALFPLQALFDVVIFDEASQCFPEKGIPSILRGKKLMVVGDAQQLKPSSLYTMRLNADDEEEDLQASSESLLDLAELFLHKAGLESHYRSRSPELIAFSNTHFYRGKLDMLPSYEAMQNPLPALEYIKVAGKWENNSNTVEAHKVVDIILDYMAKGKESIGVITFNVYQRDVIQQLLEIRLADANLTAPKLLFIKNIENVQGDERDYIIFSIAYAPDAKGRLNRNFGTLSTSGGENRLNVAITRSKIKNTIVASIEPHELATDDLTNEGPKKLEAYLRFAKDISVNGYMPTFNTTESGKSSLSKQLSLAISQLEPKMQAADLTWVQAKENKFLVYTDDDRYAKATNLKAIHAYLPLHLAAKKWPFTKVYSREWWQQKDKVMENLMAKYKETN